ncbi:Carbohydrate kinase PfkB [Corchorus olitorius]|uniref:Inositol 3-kinase n=1 Tax=Corchorus olitorius TaxID=93759 RepID=A0A1R3J6G8_9ROSI|nr:Carbohydrate kinase PfkB [Corchorus olitorius]
MVTTKTQTQDNPIPSVLIVGNYCHDVLLQGGAVVAETLGGAASFISNVLTGLSVSFHLTSKVGLDFNYPLNYNPIVVQTSKTTVFHAYFDLASSENAHQDRVLKRVEACDPIYPSDLPDRRFDYGMAVGVGGEILPETLEKMVDICDVVFVDIQALIRAFDKNGTVNLVGLKESGFYHLLPRLKFLKASSEEALFMDVEEVRKWCCVVVTHGKDGCQVYWKDGETQIAPFRANQVDPTGAGDTFLGGLVAGLAHGLVVPDAALLGNFFGSLAVAHIGLPKFDLRLLQRVKDEMQRSKLNCSCCLERRDDGLIFTKTSGHDEFHASLASTKLISTCSIQECQRDLPRSPRTVDQVILPQYNGQPKFLVSSVFDEPV